MTDEITIKVPDIGGATDVEVIEILVKPGDEILKDASLITLESDKASMDIPADKSGKVANILVKLGDKVSQDTPILTLENTGSISNTKADEKPNNESSGEKNTTDTELSDSIQDRRSDNKTQGRENNSDTVSSEIAIPDIGGASDVDVIEILVKPGDFVEKEQSLITLEGDKATMDIPSPKAGVIEKIILKVGDKVSQGSAILMLNTTDDKEHSTEADQHNVSTSTTQDSERSTDNHQSNSVRVEKPALAESTHDAYPQGRSDPSLSSSALISAGPSVRRQARELGVDLSQIKGSGRKSRILKEDLFAYVKRTINQKTATVGLNIPEVPAIDFSKFGHIENKPLNKIKRLTGANVHRAWITIPHVTQFDEADITELEIFRKAEQPLVSGGVKLTVLAFVTKVIYKALIQFPQFNASLDSSGEHLILKQYFNIGIAVETPNGLVVPVIKEVDKLSVVEIADKMAKLSKKAREKALTPADMSGGCFTISSLGGIGGTAFTPIVNSPEVAILGLSRATMKPVYQHNEFKPRLILPLSLSYDHRVIDGAEAARFTRYIADQLADIRRILL